MHMKECIHSMQKIAPWPPQVAAYSFTYIGIGARKFAKLLRQSLNKHCFEKETRLSCVV